LTFLKQSKKSSKVLCYVTEKKSDETKTREKSKIHLFAVFFAPVHAVMKRQATLGKFFFTKRVKHRGSYVEEKIPDLVESGPPKHIQCDFCDSKFEKENGYSIHLKCKHAG